MSRSFDYRAATLIEVAHHFHTIQNQAYSKLVAYYTTRGDKAMVDKVVQARKLSQIYKLVKAYKTEYSITEGLGL